MMSPEDNYKRVIKVSICVVTFNQKNYLRECLDGLVAQKVDFDFEIIVGDDASTDGTTDLVKDYAKRYPHLIVPVLHEKNIGPTKNYISVHSKARGEYVCHMDGDDVAYPGKLQAQADFLNRNEKCVLVWHKVNVFDDAGDVSRILHNRLDEVVDVNFITKKDILRYGMLGAHSSTMYRRSAAPDFESIKEEVLDYFIIALILCSGSGCRLDGVLGGYRVNASKKTASKNKSLYFNNSPIRKIYCEHLAWFFLKDNTGDFKDSIFLNATFNFFVDVRFLRPSSLYFFALAIRTVSYSGILGITEYFSKAMKLRAIS